ncbi:hypothetical protein NPIL_153661 [Nephila pilipes]|uniref:Uncharacterized protein n=1 Tax=Nephila pilipes TaxID=299642 RepID=A0A8X6TT45_NEPPI|nr:hypothetical protein NPIL_153661 [Nephila pilipes]
MHAKSGRCILLVIRGRSSWRPDADIGTVQHENHQPSLGFARARKRVPGTTREMRCSFEATHPYFSMTLFQGLRTLHEEKNRISSLVPPRASLSSFALRHQRPKDQVVLLLLLSHGGWNGPSVTLLSCTSESSKLVRDVVQKVTFPHFVTKDKNIQKVLVP